MALADSLKEEEANSPKTSVCSISKIKEGMDKADLAVFEKAIYDRGIKASVLERALKKEGISLSQGTITRHRNGWCKTCGA
jgi:hypothetical protein